ncbi:IS3 family transposase [Nocardia amamiensis]|uniref:IS3 family transposase n=1 Tax=Nocardia amamiensis TaxID=404578 RepID=UPI0034DD4EF6
MRRNVADQLRDPYGRRPCGLNCSPVTRRGRIREPPHFEGIDRVHYYNHERRHSALGMLSPVRYEQSLTVAAEAA